MKRSSVRSTEPRPELTREEQARLFHGLLVAAEEEGRLTDGSVAVRWLVIKRRIEQADQVSEAEHHALEDLLNELDREGAFAGTWLHARWVSAKHRGGETRKA